MKDASRALPAMVIALIAVVAFAVLPVLSDTVNADDGSVGTSFDITGKRARDIEGGIQVYIDAIAKSGGGIATIVGSKNNANAIDILVWSTVTVVWKAEYSGETETALIKVRGTGTFEIADGAEIEAERIAITVNGGASLVISGGSVTAERCVVHVNDGTVKMTGGTVTADDKDGFAIHIPGTGAAAYLPGICSGDLDTGPNGSIAAVDTLAIPGERHGTSEGLTFKAGGVDAVWDLSSERPVISFSNGYQIEWGEAALMPITVAEIPVPAPPAAGAVPAANIETEQYTGDLAWDTAAPVFGYGTVYSATITIIPKPGYTLAGTPANFFTVSGATVIDPGNGTVHVTFARTEEAPDTVSILTIPGITPPKGTEGPSPPIETEQYTGAVTWNTTPEADTATITLVAKEGYTFNGVSADSFTVSGAATVTNKADSGVVTAVFMMKKDTPAGGAAGTDNTVIIMVAVIAALAVMVLAAYAFAMRPKP